jgi:beta-aspartyl-peptidase (threonine type)
MSPPPIALCVHGGAGVLTRQHTTPKASLQYRSELEKALRAGHAVLTSGGTALDAVMVAVSALEDCPLFNAGRGSVLTADGEVEMDAAIMDGEALRAGAVTGVRRVKNPVRLARQVMERSGHVLLAGEGAERFARECDLDFQPLAYFVTEKRRAQLERTRAASPQATSLSESEPASKKFGTVGAVALDRNGHLAAATSTGGMTNKRPGRIGDSPVIGAGTYADDRAAAVSATGHGEMFLRVAAAHEVCARMRHGGASLREAADRVVHEELPRVGGQGGLIAVDGRGRVVWSLNTAGMYRGQIDEAGSVRTAIFADEEGD